MKPGESFTYQDKELFAVSSRGGCSKDDIRCTFEDNTGCCRAPVAGIPACDGIFFVTPLQYLELKLFGKA